MSTPVTLDGRECAVSKCRARKLTFLAACIRAGCMVRFYHCKGHRIEAAEVFRHHREAHAHEDAQPQDDDE